MKRARGLSLACLFLVSVTASIPSGAQAPPKMEEPATLNVYRVNPVTGALMPLEAITSETENVGRRYQSYLPGAASAVSFPYSERYMFAARVLDGFVGWGNKKPETLESQRESPTYKLERMSVKDGRRYATNVFVPLDVATYGEVVYGLDWTTSNRSARTFLYTPREPLPTGEYALSTSGVLPGGGAHPVNAYAFRIVAGAPAPAAADLQQTRKAAEQGDAVAQLNLGWAYAQGLGVEKDDREALNWFRKSAEQGNAHAQTNVGFRYARGLGIAKDEREAVNWYRKAAEQGNAVGQNNLGWMYWKGLGVEKDEREAANWFRKSAEQGYETAKINLRKLNE